MKFGVPISLLLHAGFLSGSIFLFRTPPPLPSERLIIPIDIISVAEQTNIKASVKRPDPDPKPEPEPEAAPEPEAEAEKPAPEASDGSTLLAGEEELASRKGTWKYDPSGK